MLCGALLSCHDIAVVIGQSEYVRQVELVLVNCALPTVPVRVGDQDTRARADVDGKERVRARARRVREEPAGAA